MRGSKREGKFSPSSTEQVNVARSKKRHHLSTRVLKQVKADGSIDLLALFPEPPSNLDRDQDQSGGERYAKEYIYRVLHELLLGGIPLTVIARKFRVDIRTVHLWKRRLFDRYREDARHIEPGTLVGEVLETYRAMIATGMREILEAGEKDVARRHAGAMLVLKAQGDLVEFMHLAGLLAGLLSQQPQTTA